MISVICVYNNRSTVDEMLLKGLENQSIDHEIILIDNSSNTFTSAASALNHGAEKARGNNLVFCHQDIFFEEYDALEKIQDTMYLFGNKVIVGVAGRDESDSVVTNITHGENKEYAGSIRAEGIKNVQVLDEVLIATSKEVFNKIKFDAEICNDWHFYGVDFCLSASTIGINSVVIPIELYHKSQGKLSRAYFSTLVKVAKKHRKNHKEIRCTMSSFKNNFIATNFYVKKHMLSLKLKGQL